MERGAKEKASSDGWDWFETSASQTMPIEQDDLARSFARCFNGNDGAIVLRHIRQTVLDRRLGPNATDAELRFLEGQRSFAAHILSMIDRGRG
ncbi:MAG: hypothetical protein ACR2RF_07290 [Geminicoccaceae bacterium]